MTNTEEKQLTKRGEIILAAIVWGLPIALVGTWIALRELPPEVACAFYDNWYLKVLWPFNVSIYQQLELVRFPTPNRCLVIAGNSLFSAYFAVLVAFGGWATIRHVKKDYKLRAARDFRILPFSLFPAYFLFLSWWVCRFDDNASGRGSTLVYKTFNSPGMLVSKTLIWITMDCFLVGIVIVMGLLKIVAFLAPRKLFEN